MERRPNILFRVYTVILAARLPVAPDDRPDFYIDLQTRRALKALKRKEKREKRNEK
jgi:hypothetical protein